MPKMLSIGPNPDYKPATPEQKDQWAAIRGQPLRRLPYITAMENVRLSGNMYVPFPDGEAVMAPEPRRLEDMEIDQLKVMLLSLGIKTEKRMTKAQVVGLIRNRMSDIDIVEGEEGEE
jgi:hypothetical protein